MGIKSGIKKIASNIIDIRVDKWLGYNQLKYTTASIINTVRSTFTQSKATYVETFEESMHRQRLTEADLEQRTKEFTRLTIIYICIASILFFYAIYMAIYSHGFASIISLSLTLYYLAQAFKFHFWLFQIKHRKLGCTMQEWLNSKISPNPIEVKK